MFDRNKIIKQLVDDDIDFAEYNEGFLHDILKHGFIGYDHFTDDELKQKATEREALNDLLERFDA